MMKNCRFSLSVYGSQNEIPYQKMANTAIPACLLHLAYNLKGDNELS